MELFIAETRSSKGFTQLWSLDMQSNLNVCSGKMTNFFLVFLWFYNAWCPNAIIFARRNFVGIVPAVGAKYYIVQW